MSTTTEPPGSCQTLERRCAWCGRTPIDGAWSNEGKAVTEHEATHTICPYCFAEQEERRLEVERATRLDQRARQIG